MAGRLKGGSPLQTAIFGLLKASARLARASAEEPGDEDAVREALARTFRAARRVDRAADRVEDLTA
jgi:hypothetical protein